MFRSWFGKEHSIECHVTLRGAVEHLYKEKSNFLFLDYDIHDKSDRTMREYLRVDSWRRELDGLDLAYYVAKRLPVEKRPDHIIIHSRNPIGRKLMHEYLHRYDIPSLLWAFDYVWTGLDGTTVPPPKPPKIYTSSSDFKTTDSKWEPKPKAREGGGPLWTDDQIDFWLGGPKKNKRKTEPKKERPVIELTGREFPVGTKVRYSDRFMTEHGSEGDRKWFTVLDCGCGLCRAGDFVAVDEPNEFHKDKKRHLYTANLWKLGEAR